MLQLETVIHKVFDNVVHTVQLRGKCVVLKYDGRIRTICNAVYSSEDAALESFNNLVSAAKWMGFPIGNATGA